MTTRRSFIKGVLAVSLAPAAPLSSRAGAPPEPITGIDFDPFDIVSFRGSAYWVNPSNELVFLRPHADDYPHYYTTPTRI